MAKHKDQNEQEIKQGKVIKGEESNDHNKEIEDLNKQIEEYKAHYLRALADYKNLENRVRNEREQMRDSIKKQVIEHFLPIIDNIDQAEIFTSDPGLKMIGNNFRQTLKDLGVNEIELLGNEYDPHTAEVVEAVEGKQDNIIVEVLQKAYAMNGEVIRYGRVKVSRKSSSN